MLLRSSLPVRWLSNAYATVLFFSFSRENFAFLVSFSFLFFSFSFLFFSHDLSFGPLVYHYPRITTRKETCFRWICRLPWHYLPPLYRLHSHRLSLLSHRLSHCLRPLAVASSVLLSLCSKTISWLPNLSATGLRPAAAFMSVSIVCHRFPSCFSPSVYPLPVLRSYLPAAAKLIILSAATSQLTCRHLSHRGLFQQSAPF